MHSQINLHLPLNQTKPGENVTITVDAKENSYVGLLGVDQSVLLLKSGNDINNEAVQVELSRFNDYDVYNYVRFTSRQQKYFENFAKSQEC